MTQNFRRAPVWVPALVLLIGITLRLTMLHLDVRFHPDEALFAAQARLISEQGDTLLRTTDLDKPPLTFYVTAFSFRLFGSTEFAARLPDVLFSSLSLAVGYALAWSLYRDRLTALLAALLWALSPYDLAFAATAFTDIQATFWVLAACWLAVCELWPLAGCAAALAFAAKTNAALFVPLILLLGLARNVQSYWRFRDLARRLWRFAWPLAAGIGLLILWDLGRAPRSFLSLGYVRNNPGRFIRADEVWPRLEQWGHWLSFIFGSPILSITLGAGTLLWLGSRVLYPRSRSAALDGLITGFGLAFLAWYWLIAFNTYDRYLHTLVPFLILLAARALTGLWRWSGQRMIAGVLIAGITVSLMLPATLKTLRGKSAIGGDQGQHNGIDVLAGYLNTRLSGQRVYDHWLGWELAYYLGEAPRVSLLYAPLPEALADDALHAAGSRFFVAPSPQAAAPWLAALHRVGIQTPVIYFDAAHHFVVYRLDRAKSPEPD